MRVNTGSLWYEIHVEGLQQKKKKEFAKVTCGLQLLLLIFAKYDKKNLMGNWKWYCFVWRHNLFKFEVSIRQNYVTSQKWVEISHCSCKITWKFVIFACLSTYVQTKLLRFSNLHSLTQIAYKETCCKPVSEYNMKISHFLPKLSYFSSKLCFIRQTYVILSCYSTHIQKLMLRVSKFVFFDSNNL